MFTDTTGIQIDSIDYWLEQKGTFASELQRVDLWLADRNTTKAAQLLSAVLLNYQLSVKQASEYAFFNDLKELQITMMNQGESILDFDSLEVQELEDIANQSEWIAGQQARNILNFAYGYDYKPDIFMPFSSSGSKLAKYSEKALDKKAIYAFPNPASDLVTFRYQLEEYTTNTKVMVYDIMGKVKFETPISKKQGFVEWNTARVIKGLYIYTIMNNGKVIGSGQVMIAH